MKKFMMLFVLVSTVAMGNTVERMLNKRLEAYDSLKVVREKFLDTAMNKESTERDIEIAYLRLQYEERVVKALDEAYSDAVLVEVSKLIGSVEVTEELRRKILKKADEKMN